MASLSYDLLPVARLTADDLAAWTSLVATDARFGSPFFHPAYAQGVGAVRDGVQVCRLRDGRRPVGFFSFERRPDGAAHPVGGNMSNFQGVVAAPGVPWDAASLARALDVSALHFHHQLAEQSEFAPYVSRQAESPVIALGGGWDAYLAERERGGVSSFNALPRKMRKLEREVGPIRFEPHVGDDGAHGAALASLVAWKRAQYERTGARGSLQHDWAVAALRKLFAVQTPAFAGMLSALYAGDRLIAVHAGMRTPSAWTYWFPTYDPEMGRYSPGLVLVYEMVRWAADAGLARIDLGPGAGAHKELFGTGDTMVTVGRVDVPPLARLVTRLRRRASRVARSMGLPHVS